MEIASSKTLKAPVAFDPIIVMITIALVVCSLVMVYSTTGVVSQERFGDSYYYVKRQSMAALLGLGFMIAVSYIPVTFWRKASPYLLIMCVALLGMTLMPGLSDKAGGARRWVKIASLRFQPGEFVKLFFVIFLAGFLSRHEAKIATLKGGIIKPFLLVGLVAGLLLMQPDFGSAAIIAGVSLGMIMAAGARVYYLMLGALVLACAVVVLIYISPYRMMRVISFLSPEADLSGKGYQLHQSLIAVGSGGLMGSGLGNSQQKLFFLPAAHTDFIFAVIAEELGLLGCLGVLVAFLTILYRGLKLAGRITEDTFAFSLAVGLTLLIVLPALLNVGVVLGMLPTKGLVLPLVGYGGTSLVACLMAVGLLLSLTRVQRAYLS